LQILADGKKENGEAELVQPAADDANERHQSHHAPAIKYVRENFEAHVGARKLQRRRYVKERSGARESKETEVEADQLTAQALRISGWYLLQSNVPIGARSDLQGRHTDLLS
jgi:hypothetical protein